MKAVLVKSLVVLFLALGWSTAGAVLQIDVEEVAGDVVLTLSGQADITDLVVSGAAIASSGSQSASFGPLIFEVTAGGPGSVERYVIDDSTVSPFGSAPGVTNFATSDAGDTVLIVSTGTPGGTILGLPNGYVSNTPLSGTGSFAGETFASLGFAVGTYTYPWGTTNADSLVINVIDPSAGPGAGPGAGPSGSEPIPALPIPLLGLLVALMAVVGARKFKEAGRKQ